MGCNTDCRPSFSGIAVLGAFALAILIGILFGFGFLPLFEPVVYVLIGVGVIFAALFVAAAAIGARADGVYESCFGFAARTWAAGFIGTVASALAVLAFVGIAPAWLGGVLVGLLTLFTALLLIGIGRYAFCLSESTDSSDIDL